MAVKDKRKPLATLPDFLMRINIFWLVIAPLVLALILLASLLSLGEKMFNGEIPDAYYSFSGIIFLLTASLVFGAKLRNKFEKLTWIGIFAPNIILKFRTLTNE
jgi:hypothetical protein